MCPQGRGDAERFVFLFCMLLWWLEPTSAIPPLNKLSLENNDSLAVLSSLHKEVRMQQAPGKHVAPGLYTAVTTQTGHCCKWNHGPAGHELCRELPPGLLSIIFSSTSRPQRS